MILNVLEDLKYQVQNKCEIRVIQAPHSGTMSCLMWGQHVGAMVSTVRSQQEGPGF